MDEAKGEIMKKTKKMKPVKAWALLEKGRILTSEGYIPYLKIHNRKSDASLFTFYSPERTVVRVEIREI